VTDEKTLEKCARAYGIDVKSRRFDTYSELRSACFDVRNALREQFEREHAIGAKRPSSDH